MTLKHPIRFIKNHQINITLFIILCIFSYFIYKKYKGDLIEGATDNSSSTCNLNITLMNRYYKIFDDIQKKIDSHIDNTTNHINLYKRNKDVEKNKLQQQANKNFKQ